MNTPERESWSGLPGFILAAAGSAIGLGNIWKFPYITGINGGGAFVLVYLVAILVLGMPIMLCEMAIGRHTRKNPYGAFAALQLRRAFLSDFLGGGLVVMSLILALRGSAGFSILAATSGILTLFFGFKLLGLAVIVGGYVIFSYYSVVGGWILAYIGKSFSGGLRYTTLADAKTAFETFAASPGQSISMHLLFMTLCALMLIGGIRSGIEKWSKILMPALFFLLVAVIVRSVTLSGAGKGIDFFINPDFSKLSAGGILEALGHAFFSLSLGMGITITYGSYLKKNQNIFKAAFWILLLDTLIAVMAGFAIFPAVFAMGFNPGAGPSLIFEILPATFSHFPGGIGWLWAGCFFIMLGIAAVTSGVSLLEIGVTFMMDQFRWRRGPAVATGWILVSAFGILSAVSVGSWDRLPGIQKILGFVFGAENIPGSFFMMTDSICSNWLLPLSGMLTALFTGWVWGARKAARELRRGTSGFADLNLITLLSGFRGEPLYKVNPNHGLTVMTLWAILIRFAAPLIVMAVFLRSIGFTLGI